jgi:serine/threonine protein phosphatase PrpC
MHPSIDQGPDCMEQILHEAFAQTQLQWREHVAEHGSSDGAGSTAVIAIFLNKDLFIAWVGDSTAILYIDNAARREFTRPHKACVAVCFNSFIWCDHIFLLVLV